MDGKVDSGERALAAIAGRQHGVVSIGQLRAVGISDDAVRARVRTGRLHRVHRGVYAVGHRALPLHGRLMAALLAHGEAEGAGSVLDHWGALISHRSACELWGLLDPVEGPVDVSVPGEAGRGRRDEIRLHRSRTLAPRHARLRDGVPVTSPARTVADLRQSLRRGVRPVSPRALRRAVRQAEVLGLPLAGDEPSDRSRSDLEGDFLTLCRRRGLPAPEVNVRVGPHRPDFLWRDARLVVETDGWRYHRGRAAFERDRAQALALRALGYEVLRISDRQVAERPEWVADTVAAALGHRTRAPPSREIDSRGGETS